MVKSFHEMGKISIKASFCAITNKSSCGLTLLCRKQMFAEKLDAFGFCVQKSF